jgi:hypothetical protein
MGFFGPEPFDSARASYVWTGVRTPGLLVVEVSGEAPNYTAGIELQRDPHWVGGIKLDVMGWTGPEGPGTKAYTVSTSLPGQFVPEIVIQGSNKREVIPVTEIGEDQAEEFMGAQEAASA